MRSLCVALSVLAPLCILGCGKTDPSPGQESAQGSSAGAAGGGITSVGPDVGPVTPVTGTSLDDASGGGVNSAAMKKAKGIAAQGVGSVNNAERQGYGPGDDYRKQKRPSFRRASLHRIR